MAKKKRPGKKRTVQDDKIREEEIKRRTEIVEQQDAEIEMLSQIYFDEFLSDDEATDFDFPKSVGIRLQPRTGDNEEAHVEVTLRVRIPRDYPFRAASCTISDAKGIGDPELKMLERELQVLANEKVGEVCIFELANHTQDFLGNHNEKFADSVHDEMTSRIEKEKASLLAIERQAEQDRKQQEEVVLRQRLREEMSKKKRRAAQSREHQQQQQEQPETPYLMDDIFTMDDIADDPVSETASLSGTETCKRVQYEFGRGLLDPQSCGDSDSDSSDSDTSDERDWEEEKDEDEDEDEIDISLDPTVFGTTPLQRFFVSEKPLKSFDKESSAIRPKSILTTPKSRYLENFEEICLLGRGGFGEVVKARNKLDGHLYGIKKVVIRSNNAKARMRIMREVTTIARLHHKYIVRYFQAWVEGSADTDDSDPRRSELESNFAEYEPSEVHDWMQKGATLSESGDESFLNDFSPVAHAHPLMQMQRSPPKARNDSKEMLYIQFEYCPNRTLRDVIDEGVSHAPDKIWRLFRQILEALEYIHAKGIVHRDIKPPNVFLDEREDIKIGDFGLATATKSPSAESGTPTAGLQRSMSTNSVSGVAGTPYYRSPEQESGTIVNQKADMYAMGVLFFEMWTPFGTLMERHEALTELRATGMVPASRTHALTDAVVNVVQWLLKANPDERPTASELLHSELVPLAEDEQYLREALHAFTSANSAFRPRVIDVLFSQDPDRAVDLTYDAKACSLDMSEAHMQARMRLFQRVEDVFRRHGAVHMRTPLLTPRVSVLKESAPSTLLDITGTLVQLPHSLTVPFARFVALKNINSVRRYDVSRVFRQSVAGGQPHESYVCDFDIVYPSSRTGRRQGIYMCEVIGVVDEVIASFSSHLTRHCIYVNHLLLLETVFDALIPPDRYPRARKAIGSLLAQLGRVRWSSVKRTLLGEFHLREEDVNMLGVFVTLKGTHDNTIPKAENFLRAQGLFSSKVATALEGVSNLFRLLESVQISSKVLFHAGLVGDIQMYRSGFVFQVVQEGQSKKRTENIALGGRYDRLIASFCPPSTSGNSATSAVGVSIAIEHILEHENESERVRSSRKKGNMAGSTPLDDLAVVLYANSGKLLEERFAIASLLWSNGVRAEYSFPDMHNAATMPKFCRMRHSRWLAVFRPKLLARGLIRLCDLLLTTQADIEVRSLVSHILRATQQNNEPNTSLSSTAEPEVEFIHPNLATFRSHQCSQHARAAQSVAMPLLGGLERQQYALLCAYVPIDVVRQLGSAFYEGGSEALALIPEASHIPHAYKEHLRLLTARLLDLVAKDRRLVLRYIFIYCVEDRRLDIITL